MNEHGPPLRSGTDIFSLRRRNRALEAARKALQAELTSHTTASPANAKHLVHLRTAAETFASQTDALIAAMKAQNLLSGQIREAEDLRVFFRIAAGCFSALLEAHLSRKENQASVQAAGPTQARRLRVGS